MILEETGWEKGGGGHLLTGFSTLFAISRRNQCQQGLWIATDLNPGPPPAPTHPVRLNSRSSRPSLQPSPLSRPYCHVEASGSRLHIHMSALQSKANLLW